MRGSGRGTGWLSERSGGGYEDWWGDGDEEGQYGETLAVWRRCVGVEEPEGLGRGEGRE
jgi:hypothetical protein